MKIIAPLALAATLVAVAVPVAVQTATRQPALSYGLTENSWWASHSAAAMQPSTAR